MGLSVSDLTSATKRALFGGAKTKAVIVLKQYWKDESEGGIDANGNISVGGLSKTASTGKITIEDSVTVAKSKAAGVSSAGNLSAASGLSDSLASAASSASSLVASATSLLNSTLGDNSNTSDAGSVKKGSTTTSAGKNCKSVEYTVMFNPETLRISSRGGGYIESFKNNFGVAKDGSSDVNSTASITYIQDEHRSVSLSMDLIFDKVNSSDAFSVIDPFSYNLTGGSIKNLVSNVSGTDYSVQRDVEGFLGALRDHRTTEITLRWGDIEYTGVVTNINANYTMFNPKGDPIRAVVGFQMRIIDPSNSNDSIAMGQYFTGVCEKMLMDKEIQANGYTSWNTLKNKVGSYINL